MVLTEFWTAFLPERRTVAGGLGVHPVFGQPGDDSLLTALPPLHHLIIDIELSVWSGFFVK